MSELGEHLAGIECADCGEPLPSKWLNEPADARSPCSKCGGTARKLAFRLPGPLPDTERGRG